MPTDTTIFELQEVCYRYSEVDALEKVTLAIGKGERIAVLGANGSGKSTLLRLLAGLVFSSSGVKTVLTCTHDLHIVEDIADRCVVLKNGCIAADGIPALILAS
jgi:energy-coupling factor transporter ATP-binding protein EcfA2